MKTSQAIDALSALAQESRLAIYRVLVETGPEGLAAGAIADKLRIPAATLSFHLAHLTRAGLVTQAQAGRFVIYAADFANMNELVGFLTENCCAGKSCAPVSSKTTSKRA
jgi:ArsR family transcriptional regulator